MASTARDHAAIFAALGDPTRLALVETLSDGHARSISELASGAAMSRQAVTKHLKVLETAGLVANDRVGRETRFALEPSKLNDLADYLQSVSRHWDEAISRLKTFLGED